MKSINEFLVKKHIKNIKCFSELEEGDYIYNLLYAIKYNKYYSLDKGLITKIEEGKEYVTFYYYLSGGDREDNYVDITKSSMGKESMIDRPLTDYIIFAGTSEEAIKNEIKKYEDNK